MSKLSSQKPTLGDYFSQRTEPGRGGLPTLSVTLRDGLVFRDDLDRKTDTSLEHHEHLLTREGDIAYNMMRMWQGASGRASANGLVSPAYVVLSPTDKIDTRFAAHWFKSARMIYLFWAYSHGLTEDRLRLYYDDFAEIPATPPCPPEQRRIAAILDEWDDAIATVEKLVEAKKKRQSAVLSTVFANAPKRPLYEIADVIMGQSPPSSAYREPGTGELPLIQGAADFSNGLVVATSDTDSVTKSVDQPCIVMSVRAPVGTIARLAFPACLGRGVCAIVPKDDLGLDYIASVVTGLSPYWATMAQGSSFEAVSGEVIRDALVPYGTPDFVGNAALVFQAMSQELNQEAERIQALRFQKRGLMQKLLSGDLPVPASIDRLLPSEQEVDEAVEAEVQRAEATG